MVKPCPVCGTEFEVVGNKTYCRRRCKEQAKDARQYVPIPGGEELTNICAGCGESFSWIRPKAGRLRMYCSEICRSRAQRNYTPPEQRECRVCGRTFLPKSLGRTAIYCSQQCSQRGQWERLWIRLVEDPAVRAAKQRNNMEWRRRVTREAQAFRAMYEPVQTWWSLIKDALENRTDLPEPPVSENIAV